jgi:hypothetical protein
LGIIGVLASSLVNIIAASGDDVLQAAAVGLAGAVNIVLILGCTLLGDGRTQSDQIFVRISLNPCHQNALNSKVNMIQIRRRPEPHLGL